VKGIVNQGGPDGGPTDNDQFGGLHENLKVSVFHQFSGDDRAENHDNSNDGKRSASTL